MWYFIEYHHIFNILLKTMFILYIYDYGYFDMLQYNSLLESLVVSGYLYIFFHWLGTLCPKTETKNVHILFLCPNISQSKSLELIFWLLVQYLYGKYCIYKPCIPLAPNLIITTFNIGDCLIIISKQVLKFHSNIYLCIHKNNS